MKKALDILKENHRLLEEETNLKIPFVIKQKEAEKSIYGSYNLTLVLPLVNINEMIILSGEVERKLEKGSYNKNVIKPFSESFISSLPDTHKHIALSLQGAIVGLYLPLSYYNENWVNENPKCQYLKEVPKAKKLPIIDKTEKQLFKFLTKNKEDILTLIKNS